MKLQGLLLLFTLGSFLYSEISFSGTKSSDNRSTHSQNRISSTPADTADYDDYLCNGWIYNFLSSFQDSCLIDTLSKDTIIRIEFEVADTTIVFESIVLLEYVTKTCYDMSFGVFETEDVSDKFYYQNIITSWDTLGFDITVFLNGYEVSLDSLPDSLDISSFASISETFIVGWKTQAIIDCTGDLETICFNDTICADILQYYSLADSQWAQTILDEAIGPYYYPDTSGWDFIELWNFTDRQEAPCNADSRRVNPCDTCTYELFTGFEILPDLCEESQLQLVLNGEYSYAYCGIESIEINESFSIVNIDITYSKPADFEFCEACGMAFSDTIALGMLDAKNYTFSFNDILGDSILHEADVEIKNCFIPFCPAPPASQLNTSDVTHNSATLNYIPGGIYVNYSWQYKKCEDPAWIDITTTSTPSSAVENLDAQEEYCWRVSALCGNGIRSAYSEEIRFHTLADPACEIADTSYSLVSENLTSNSVELIFIGDTYEAYEFRLMVCDSTEWISYGPSSEASIIITTLEGETSYCWQVRVLCSNGIWSDWLEGDGPSGSFTTLSTSLIDVHETGLHIHIFPNPFTEELYITGNLKPAEASVLRIYNTSGALIYKNPFDGDMLLPGDLFTQPGIYILTIQSHSNIQTKKLIKL